jgi:hypothetical protein
LNRILHILIFSLLCTSCGKEENGKRESGCADPEFISAVDISSYPEISMTDPVFYDLEQLQLMAEQWAYDFNHNHPHTALGGMAPIKYRLQGERRPASFSPANTHQSPNLALS